MQSRRPSPGSGMEERQWPGNARWQSSQVGKRKIEERGPGALWQRNQLELKLGIHRPRGVGGAQEVRVRVRVRRKWV